MYSPGSLRNKAHASTANGWISVDGANLTPLMAAPPLTTPVTK